MGTKTPILIIKAAISPERGSRNERTAHTPSLEVRNGCTTCVWADEAPGNPETLEPVSDVFNMGNDIGNGPETRNFH